MANRRTFSRVAISENQGVTARSGATNNNRYFPAGQIAFDFAPLVAIQTGVQRRRGIAAFAQAIDLIFHQ